MDFQNASTNDARLETPKAALIDSIVNDSYKANSMPNRQTAAPIGRPIRAGGRPRKNGAPNKATLALIQAEFEEKKTTPPPLQSDSTGSTGNGEASSAFSESETLKADDIPDAALVQVLKAPFDILRASTGFDGYKLDDETAKDLTPLLKTVLEIYLPNVPSKHMPAIILAGTLGTILYRQYGEHQTFLRATHVKATVEPKRPDPEPAIFKPEVSGA
jgi:hypothetical protein